MPITTTERATPVYSPVSDAALPTRTVTRFAWLPLTLDTGERVRWCRYLAHEVLEPDYGGWSTGLWVRLGAERLA